MAGQTNQATKASDKQAAVSPDPPGLPARTPGLPATTGRDRARRTRQFGLLSLAIGVALLGCAYHPLSIAAVVLMVLLWGLMASELRSGRGSGSVVTEVVTALAAEVKDLTDAASGQGLTDSADRGQTAPAEPVEMAGSDQHDQDRGAITRAHSQGSNGSGSEPTKKELYADAREAGIEGRSTMSKEELKRALEGRMARGSS